jgi:hypothetical protein
LLPAGFNIHRFAKDWTATRAARPGTSDRGRRRVPALTAVTSRSSRSRRAASAGGRQSRRGAEGSAGPRAREGAGRRHLR